MAREKVKVINQGSFGGVFFATYVGAAIYFVQHTHGFWGTIWGLMEAAVWPGFVVYHVLTLLHV
jgi:hypothetical protein